MVKLKRLSHVKLVSALMTNHMLGILQNMSLQLRPIFKADAAPSIMYMLLRISLLFFPSRW